jgi:hypothetical protein
VTERTWHRGGLIRAEDARRLGADFLNVPHFGRHIEIEITPAMIRAGKRELSDYHTDFERPEDAVERIFIAMIEARSHK